MRWNQMETGRRGLGRGHKFNWIRRRRRRRRSDCISIGRPVVVVVVVVIGQARPLLPFAHSPGSRPLIWKSVAALEVVVKSKPRAELHDRPGELKTSSQQQWQVFDAPKPQTLSLSLLSSLIFSYFLLLFKHTDRQTDRLAGWLADVAHALAALDGPIQNSNSPH